MNGNGLFIPRNRDDKKWSPFNYESTNYCVLCVYKISHTNAEHLWGINFFLTPDIMQNLKLGILIPTYYGIRKITRIKNNLFDVYTDGLRTTTPYVPALMVNIEPNESYRGYSTETERQLSSVDFNHNMFINSNPSDAEPATYVTYREMSKKYHFWDTEINVCDLSVLRWLENSEV